MRQYDIENEQPQENAEIEIQHYEWHQVFYTIFTHPNVETFQQLLQDPEAKAQRAYLWMLLPSVLTGIASQANAAQFLGLDWFSIIIMGSIFGGFFGVIGFIISGWVMQRVAVFLGGNQENYGKFHYARGMFMPVVSMAYAALLLFPVGNMLPVYLYTAILTIELILTFMALQSVNSQLPKSQAFFSIGIWYFMIIVLGTLLGGLF